MKRQKPSRKRLLSLCAEIHPDDGADPKDFFGKQDPRGKSDRKVRQLCSQTGEALSYVLSGECNDDLLRNLEIMRVEPAPDSSRLLVVVRVNPPDAEVEPAQVLDRLAQAAGRLRAEVARAVTRKRAPKLVFECMPSAPGEGRS